MEESVLFAILVCAVIVANVQAAVKDLNLMGFIPMTGENWPGGGACLPAIEMAIRHVNARSDILEAYKLNLIWKDSKCDAGTATNVMYEMLYSEPIKHMILGPACSVEAEVTAQASPAWNLTHLSYGSASPLLSDRRRFPRFFRLASPDTRYNLVRIALAKHFNWKKIATINVALDYFSAVTDNLVQSVKETDIHIISEEIFDHDPLTRLQNLKKKDARIIMSAAYENQGRRILCAAYQVGLYGPKIVWMLPGWYVDKWWKDPNNEVPCTDEQMAIAAEGSLLTGFFYENFNIERGIANLTVPEFKELFKQEKNYQPDLTHFEFMSPNSYDAVWGIALALNCTDNILKEIGHPKSLDQFDYSDSDIADIVTSCTRNLSYLGISGKIKFGYYGNPMKTIKIDQIQGGSKVMVGVYRTDVDEPYLEWYGSGIQWRGGSPPRDSTFITEVEVVIPPYLYISMSCFAAMGIALAVSFFIFNIIHRNKVYVKLSSPNINNVLLLGCIITYTSVFMASLGEKDVTLCKLRTFTFTIGFSMAFGALFSKTWRVYRIFANKKLLRLKIKDSQLVGIVLGLIGILLFVLLLWEIIDPLFIVVRYLKTEVYVTGNDAEIHSFIRMCTSNYSNYFTWSIYIIEGLLLTFGAFLSFETRKVKIAALNDSRLIGTCLYNVVVLSAVGLTLNLVLQDEVVLLYGILSAVLIIGTTATQLIVFIPKIMAVYYPHHVASDLQGTYDGTGLNSTIHMTINSKTFAPREPCHDTTTSTKLSSADCKSFNG